MIFRRLSPTAASTARWNCKARFCGYRKITSIYSCIQCTFDLKANRQIENLGPKLCVLVIVNALAKYSHIHTSGFDTYHLLMARPGPAYPEPAGCPPQLPALLESFPTNCIPTKIRLLPAGANPQPALCSRPPAPPTRPASSRSRC